jgi:hypothetical protein
MSRMKRTPLERAAQGGEWLARYQVQGLTCEQLAQEATAAGQPTTASQVRKTIKATARLIELKGLRTHDL